MSTRSTGNGPKEAVTHIARVVVFSRDRARRIDTDGEGAVDCPWYVKGRQGSVGSPQVAVVVTIRVDVDACDRTCRVDARGVGTARDLCAGPRDIEKSECPVGGPQKAVSV